MKVRKVLEMLLEKFIRDNFIVCGGKATSKDCIYADGYNECLKDLKRFVEDNL